MRIELHGNDTGKTGIVHTGRRIYLAYAYVKYTGTHRKGKQVWLGEVNGHTGYPSDSARSAIESVVERFGF